MDSLRVHWFCCGAIALIALGAAGCGEGDKAMPKVADSDRAVDALKATLDAWKAGEAPQALSQREPRIHVNDEDWTNGFKLKDYSLSNSNVIVGLSLRCPVALTLVTPQGAPLEKNVLYSVGTDPVVSVVRQDEEG